MKLTVLTNGLYVPDHVVVKYYSAIKIGFSIENKANFVDNIKLRCLCIYWRNFLRTTIKRKE